jgi:hypothetical protein
MSKKPKEPARKASAVTPVAEDDSAALPAKERPASRASHSAALFTLVFPSLERTPATFAEIRTFADEAVAGSGRVPAGFRRGRIWA